MPSLRDFERKLQEQIAHLETSSLAYDRGDTSEALRIAIALRIIFYDRGQSVSLLTHLGRRDIRILSVAEDINRPDRFFPNLTKLVLDPAHLKQEFVPKLGTAAKKRMVSVEQWWERDLVFQDPNGIFTINRKDLVLGAANRDGGAHVDDRLEKRYELIEQGAGIGMNVNPPNGSSIVVTATNGHLASIRHMGWEVLHSPDVFRLARKGR